MDKYNRRQSDFDVSTGHSKILGFQQVISNKEKVFVWFKKEVERPVKQDRHKTTRLMNNSSRKHDWAKSVWLISKVIKHLKNYLDEKGIKREDLLNLSDDTKSDKWVVADGTERNFLKCIINDPIDYITGKELNIQITQKAGSAFSSIYERALDESEGDTLLYEELLKKYKERSVVKTYVNDLDRGVIKSNLKKVYALKNGTKLIVYEDKEIVIGETNNIFIDFEVESNIPVDFYDIEEKEIETTKVVEEKLSLTI